QGHDHPSCEFRIAKMLEGWSCQRGKVRDSWMPISPPMLCKLATIWGQICSDNVEPVLFHAASLVTFFLQH
ncbi:hypothetical protein JRQ81_002421, partial [Phrynocephalus forsythii]